MAAKTREFDKLLIRSIDEALLSLGESGRQSTYSYIKQNLNVDKTEIAQKLEQFQEGLERIFGLGARYLEILIMKNIYAQTGQSLGVAKSASLEFIKYIEAVKQSYLKEDPER